MHNSKGSVDSFTLVLWGEDQVLLEGKDNQTRKQHKLITRASQMNHPVPKRTRGDENEIEYWIGRPWSQKLFEQK